jgi:hypothetical protein
LTFEDPEDRTIFSLLRLRLPRNQSEGKTPPCIPPQQGGRKQNPPNPLYQGGPNQNPPSLLYQGGIDQNLPPLQGGNKGGIFEKLQNTALIRELHTF